MHSILEYLFEYCNDRDDDNPYIRHGRIGSGGGAGDYAGPVRIEFDSDVWRWAARTDAWFFATVPEELSAEIHELPAPPRGFSSLRVQARIGLTRWRTSIFYDGSAYVLPLKRAVRDAEGFGEGDVIVVELEILDL